MKKRIALLLAAILLFSCLPWAATPVAAAPAEKSPADGSKILDYVHEDVFEEADHLGRMEEEETLSNYVFLNKDGTRTAYYLDEAVKFVDTDGKIKEKDITLQSVRGGYTTTQNDVTVTLPITMSSGVNLSYNNYQISLIPEGGTSSAPRIVNNAAEYVDFYGADTVLKYTPTLSGVKEDIILESYTGKDTFTFTLNTNGLAVYHTKEDRYYLAPGKGTDPVYWLGALEIYDSALNMGTGEMTVETIQAGQQYKITITVDESWLTAKGRAYPVTVDPSVAANDDNKDYTIDDAPIYSGSSAIKGRNYGSNIYNCAGYMDSTYGMGRTVVRLSGLMNDEVFRDIPASAITSAKFRTYDAAGTAKTTVDLYPLTTTVVWTESNVTWNNIDGDTNSNDDDYYFTAAAYASKKFGYGSYADFDITVLVQKWKTGAFDSNYSFILIGTNESTKRGLYSSEHSTTAKRPYVEVTYEGSAMYSSYSTSDYFRNTPSHYDYVPEFAVADVPVQLYYDDGIQCRANCYGYAFRFCYSGELTDDLATYTNIANQKIHPAYKQQPGEFANKAASTMINVTVGSETVSHNLSSYLSVTTFLDLYVATSMHSDNFRLKCMYKLLEADAARFNYSITPINNNDGIVTSSTTLPAADISSGQRLIAVVVFNTDYHFYMQNADNTWSHKMGTQQPTDKCLLCSDVTLTNENIAEHAIHSDDLSGGAVGFFYTTKTTKETMHGNGTNDSCPSTPLS